MPVFDLTNEAGQPVNVETFRGRPWILTFVFTRCPMPNFCPRMSKNFSELQNTIRVANGPVAQTRLLSVTIDPQFDTPAVLKEYGQHEGADPKFWSFATGAPAEIDALVQSFAVYRQNEGGTINHGLTTALIDREGKIVKIWRGNGWTPREVVESLNSIEHGVAAAQDLVSRNQTSGVRATPLAPDCVFLCRTCRQAEAEGYSCLCRFGSLRPLLRGTLGRGQETASVSQTPQSVAQPAVALSC